MAYIPDTNNLVPSRPSLRSRYVGIDVRAGRFAFVATEGSVVLDSGNRTCGKSQFDDCLGFSLDRILKTYKPSTLILRVHTDPRTRKIAAAIRRKARKQSIRLVTIRPAMVRHYFGRHDATTKYEIAQQVAMLLPGMAWKLPPNRKPWESEHHRMSIFDAAAVLLTYFGQ